MKLLEKPKFTTARSRAGTKRALLGCAGHLLGGFVLSAGAVAGGCSPFAVALVAVSGRRDFLFSALGAGLGYMIFGVGTVRVRYFAAVLIALVGALAMAAFLPRRDARLPMALSCLAVGLTGAVLQLRLGGGAADYALVLGESILAGGGGYFFFRAEHCNYRRLRCKAAPTGDLVCVLISGSLLLMSLSRLTIFGIAPARIAAVLLILITLRFGSSRLGVTLALCLGFALGLAGQDTMFLLGAYGFSALLAALFDRFASLGCAGAFVLSMGFFSVVADLGRLSVCTFVESAVAGVLLLLLPAAWGDRCTAFFENGADIAPEGSLRQSLVLRLRFAASAMASVSDNVREVREKIDRINGKRGLPPDPEKSDMRMVAADQFYSISDMLSDLAFEFDQAECFDAKTAGKLRRLLGESEIYPKNISVILDKFDRMRVEIACDDPAPGLSSPVLQAKISKTCGRSLEAGQVTRYGSESLLTFNEKPLYCLSVGYAQYAAEGRLCGDTVKIARDGRGHQILIISDGMGRGSRAALDGAMGAGLLSRLLSAGFGFDAALKVVNSALLVKSNEESLATLDCACVDLFTGRCAFYKAGAPRSYVLRHGRLTRCELASMPAGILRGITFAKRTAVLGAGDTVVLLSDGITDADAVGLEALLCRFQSQDQQELADTVLAYAKAHTPADRRDDMSVIVARLLPN